MAACSGLLEVAVVCAKVGDKVAASESLVAVRSRNHPLFSFRLYVLSTPTLFYGKGCHTHSRCLNHVCSKAGEWRAVEGIERPFSRSFWPTGSLLACHLAPQSLSSLFYFLGPLWRRGGAHAQSQAWQLNPSLQPILQAVRSTLSVLKPLLSSERSTGAVLLLQSTRRESSKLCAASSVHLWGVCASKLCRALSGQLQGLRVTWRPNRLGS